MGSLLSRDRFIALFCMALAGYVYYESGTYPTSDFDAVGPTVYPRFLAAIIAFASLIIFFRKSSKGKKRDGEKHFGALAFVAALAILYALTLNTLGFIPVTILFLFAVVMFFDKAPMKKRLPSALLYATLFTLFLYLFFGKVLGILLPIPQIFSLS